MSHLTDVYILAAELFHKDLVHSRSGRIIASNVEADREVAHAEDPAHIQSMVPHRCIANQSDVYVDIVTKHWRSSERHTHRQA